MGRITPPAAATIDAFMTLLKASLYGTPLTAGDFPGGIDWKAVYALAVRQGVIGFISDSVEMLPEELLPPAAIRQKLFKGAYSMFTAYNRASLVLAEIMAELDKAHIPAVLIKGIGSAQYYRKPELRRFGDIDIYVGVDKFADACNLLKSEGEQFDIKRLYGHYHWCTMRGGMNIEIHRYATRLFRKRRNEIFQQFTRRQMTDNQLLRTMQAGDVEVNRPSLMFDAVYLFVHAWRHFSSYIGITVRHLTDWVMIFHDHASALDRQMLEQTIRDCGFERTWKVFAWVAVNKFGVAAEDMPMYDASFRRLGEKAFNEIIMPKRYLPISEEDRRRLGGKLKLSANHLKAACKHVKYSPGETICYTIEDIFSVFPRKLLHDR